MRIPADVLIIMGCLFILIGIGQGDGALQVSGYLTAATGICYRLVEDTVLLLWPDLFRRPIFPIVQLLLWIGGTGGVLWWLS